MSRILIAGGEILDRNGRRAGDVLVDDTTGRIAAVLDRAAADRADGGGSDRGAAPAEAAGADRVLDAAACLVCPGFVDLQAHFRQPGFEAAGTIESGSRSAALGGFTAAVASAATDPCTDSAAVVSEVLALAKSALCEVVPSAALTVGREGTRLAHYRELAELGVRLFSDADRAVLDPAVVRRALDYLGGLSEIVGARLVVGQRPQHELAAGGVVHEGEWSSRLGLAGQPSAAEELAVTRELALARLTRTPVHLQQLSTEGAVELLRAAKAEGVPVTAEVSPHHLVLTDADLADYDPTRKTDPPLRTERDRAALRDAVADGTIDAVATDHRPCAVDAKERPFDAAPFGVLGQETALAVLLTATELGIEQLLPALSWQPAAIAGVDDRHGGPIEAGRPANLAVVDPAATWTVTPSRFGGYATNSPFTGQTLTGRVRHTILGGEPVVVDGEAGR